MIARTEVALSARVIAANVMKSSSRDCIPPSPGEPRDTGVGG